MADTFYNTDAECAVLAMFVKERDAAARHIGELTEDDFFDENNKLIFKALQSLVAQKYVVDIVSVAEEMKRLYGNDNLMMNVMNIVRDFGIGAKLSFKQNLQTVKTLSFRRELYKVFDTAKENLTDSKQDASTILEQTRQKLRDLTVTGHTWESMVDVLGNTFEALERRSQGLEKAMPSGVKALDTLTTGFHKGELTIIGARPAVGKSAFAGHIALMAAKAGYKVGIVSREMTDVQYGLRIYARATGIDNNKLRTGEVTDEDWDKIVESQGAYAELPIEFMFTTRYIEDLRMEVQNKVDTGKLDILIVDYLQLMQTKRNFEQDYLRISYVSKVLKEMTVDFGIAIVALAQVGRSAQNTMPSMSELRGSGELEQDADNIIFLHRPIDDSDKYIDPKNRNLFIQLLDNPEQQYIVLNVAKQRQGTTGSVAVIFNPNRMRYTSIIRDE